MRFEFEFQPAVWGIMPPVSEQDAAADTAWVQAQIEAYASGTLASSGGGLVELGPIVAAAAREALSLRRDQVESELFFRPTNDLMFGLVHFLVSPTPEGIEDRPLQDWLFPGLQLLVDPVVVNFSTEVIEKGYRIDYVTTGVDQDGNPLAGFAYAFHQDGITGVVFSELATTEITAVQLGYCEPIVASLRIVR